MVTRITSKHVISFMSSNNPAVTVVHAGDTICFETQDCFSGRLKKPGDKLRDLEWESLNPCTGPVHIDEARQGDVLEIEIVDIKLSSHGVIILDAEDTKKYGISNVDRSLHALVMDGECCFGPDVAVKVMPMIGAIGVAPEDGEILTTLPGPHGGNMDNARIGIGAKLYLPVFHDGALLALGDLHAAMGDGEAMGCGVEIAGEVTVKVNVIKNLTLPLPLLISDGQFITIASAATLDEAATMATKMMLDCLTEGNPKRVEVAWGIMCASGQLAVCQIANKIKTMRYEVPIELLSTNNFVPDSLRGIIE